MTDILQDLEGMTREQLLGQIMYLRKRVAQLEEQNSDLGWRLNPDRSGGQFTDWEINRRGDEWA
jgi:hypothetical protein